LITGKANNLVVKKILDTLVTTFIANKFAFESESEVGVASKFQCELLIK
jgi:hypothetical protein